MEIHASSIYDFPTTRPYIRFVARKRTMFQGVFVLMGLLYEWFMVSALRNLHNRNGTWNVALILCMAAVLVFCVVTVWMIVALPLNTYKKEPSAQEMQVQYTFSEDSYQVISSGVGFLSEETIRYAALFEVWEHKGYFYLFSAPGRGSIVNKDTMSEEDIATMRDCFTAALGKRYHGKREPQIPVQ